MSKLTAEQIDEFFAECEHPRQEAEIQLQKSLRKLFEAKPFYFSPRRSDQLLMKVMQLVRKEMTGVAP